MTSPIPTADGAERSVIGAMLLAPAVIPEVLDVCSGADFYTPKYAAAFEVISHRYTTGEPVDSVLVAEDLENRQFPVPLPELLKLVSDVPLSSHGPQYGERVRRAAVARRSLAAAQEVIERARVQDIEAIPRLLDDAGFLARSFTEPRSRDRHVKTGARFVLDDPADLAPVWGRGDEVLWASGEALLIVGPPGVGKTTIALQLVEALVGISEGVLGYPVQPARGRVLYLAQDRPRQIRRAMRRRWGEEHRDVLERLLVVREGPLASDLGKEPGALLALCEQHEVTAVVIDSLKDAVIKLTDDEAGGNFNRAVQACVSSGIEVLGLHHQRKGQGGSKPNSLEDVYGSTWITAGAGSVLLLWGSAGDLVVEMRHLKQPAAEVGPLKLEHDHHAGTTSVERGQVDPLVMLRHAGANGLTSVALARAMVAGDPNDNQRKKAQRALDRLVRDGLAHRSEFSAGGAGGSGGTSYYAVDHQRQDRP